MPEESPILCPSANLTLQGVVLPNGLRVESLTAHASGLAVWTDPFRAELREGAEARATVLLRDVAALLEAMSPSGLRGFAVAGSAEGLSVEATRPGLLPVKIRAQATLEVRNSAELAVRLLSAKVFGADLGRWLEAAVEGMNPLFSVRDLPVPLRMDGVSVEPDRIVLRLSMPPAAYPP